MHTLANSIAPLRKGAITVRMVPYINYQTILQPKPNPLIVRRFATKHKSRRAKLKNGNNMPIIIRQSLKAATFLPTAPE